MAFGRPWYQVAVLSEERRLMPQGVTMQNLARGVNNLRSRSRMEWRQMSPAFKFHFLNIPEFICAFKGFSRPLKNTFVSGLYPRPPHQCKSSNYTVFIVTSHTLYVGHCLSATAMAQSSGPSLNNYL